MYDSHLIFTGKVHLFMIYIRSPARISKKRTLSLYAIDHFSVRTPPERQISAYIHFYSSKMVRCFALICQKVYFTPLFQRVFVHSQHTRSRTTLNSPHQKGPHPRPFPQTYRSSSTSGHTQTYPELSRHFTFTLNFTVIHFEAS